jgi:hypothetical protein
MVMAGLVPVIHVARSGQVSLMRVDSVDDREKPLVSREISEAP